MPKKKAKRKRKVRIVYQLVHWLSYKCNRKDPGSTLHRVDQLAERIIERSGGKIIGTGYDFPEGRRDLEVEGLSDKEADKIQEILSYETRYETSGRDLRSTPFRSKKV